jgi:hypothetical protein
MKVFVILSLIGMSIASPLGVGYVGDIVGQALRTAVDATRGGLQTAGAAVNPLGAALNPIGYVEGIVGQAVHTAEDAVKNGLKLQEKQ